MELVNLFFPLSKNGYQPDGHSFIDDVHSYLFDHYGLNLDLRYVETRNDGRDVSDGKILFTIPYADLITFNHYLADNGLLEMCKWPFLNKDIEDVTLLEATTLFGSYLRMMDLSPLYNNTLIDWHKENRGL